MVNRTFWQERVEKAWGRQSVVWVSGVRRVGKTCLAKSLPGVEYFDCELPRVRSEMRDPEGFWEGLGGKRVVLDEVHRLANPSEMLKIAADHFPTVRVLATGSSTLGALWEHFVLNEIHAATQSRSIRYWRDKRGHEVDFIWLPRGDPPLAIECKWSADAFDPGNLKVFRRLHPAGRNAVVAHDVDRPFQRVFGDVAVRFVSLADLVGMLTMPEGG